MEKNGPKYEMNDYRIPTAEEWRYAASKVPSEKKSINTGLKKVNSGIKSQPISELPPRSGVLLAAVAH